MSKEYAFPVSNDANINQDCGMSLRDYFAAKALQGCMASGSEYRTWEDAALDAYEAADAMMEVRKK